MKLVPLLTRVAALSFAALLVAVAFNVAALTAFTLAAGAFVMLIASHDYVPRRGLALPRKAIVVAFPTAPARAICPQRLAA